MSDLETRVQQFKTLSLPGQPMGMHMGTCNLVEDLWREVQRLETENARMRNALIDIRRWGAAYGHQEHCNHPGSPCTCEEPKPSAAVSDLEIIDQAYLGLWDGVCPGHAPHTEPNRNDPYWDGVKAAIRRVQPLICAAKDADTATVIADNDEKMKQLEELVRQRNEYARKLSEMQEGVERLIRERDANAEAAKLANHNQKLLAASLKDAREEIERQRGGKDEAYRERNYLVAALARLFPSGIRKTAIPGWEVDWHGCVYIDLPSGQISYHYHDSQDYLFDGLAAYTKDWDGHDKDAVHDRLIRLDCPISREHEAEIERLKFNWEEEIAAYKDVKSYDRKLIDMLAKKNQALSHPDIEAAAERGQAAFYATDTGSLWQAVARAVYGLKSEGG